MIEPAWVEPFLYHLRKSTGPRGLNVTIAAARAGVGRELAYHYRTRPGFERLRVEWESLAIQARENRKKSS